MKEEALLPFPCPRDEVPVGTRFRSTWLSASVALVKERGLFAEYLKHLAPEHKDAILHPVVGQWLEAEVAVAHYRACDALGLSEEEQVTMGRDAALRVHGPVLSVAVRMAASAGVTPWLAVSKVQSNFARIWIGGAAAIFKLGPKEARFEIAGFPPARVPYCRVALRGSLQALTALFAQKTYVSEIARLRSDLTVGYRISWV
jgi:hypothetical protein